MKNEKIIQQFINQSRYNLQLSAKRLQIMNGKLYSYSLLIAEHDGFGNIVVYDYMATGARGMVSATTSQHVSLVKRSVPRNLLILE